MKRINRPLIIIGIVASLLTASCSRTSYTNNSADVLPNDVVLNWNEVAYEAFGGISYQHSLMAARINAMVHIAMHDAINSIYPKYATYAFTGNNPGADLVAAAASAAHTVLIHEIGNRKSFLDSALQKSLGNIPEGEAKIQGIELGKLAGAAIIDNRTEDGSAANPVVPVPVAKV